MSENPWKNSFSPEEERARLERIWENYRKETKTFIPDGYKSLQVAESLKTEGNLHYSKREFREALICYNEALRNAPQDSPIVGVLYADRSAVYLEIGLPIQCQENIQMALDHGYPADKEQELEERKSKCLEMIEKLPAEAIKHEPKPFWTPVLSHPAHPKFPFLSNAVDIEIDEAEGPKLVAKEDIRPGDIFLFNPYDMFVLVGTRKENKENYYDLCAFCTWPDYLSLIPCSECIHVMYCKKCLPKWEKIHKFECKMWETDSDKTLMVRVLIQTLDLYDFDLELLKKDIEEVQNSPKVLLEGDYVNDLKRQIVKWIFPRWNWNLHTDLLVQRGNFASYLLEKLLHLNSDFATLVSTRERKITALQILFSFPYHLTRQESTSIDYILYQPFTGRFSTCDATKINSIDFGGHGDFSICLLPVKCGKEINIGTSPYAIFNYMPKEALTWRIFSECKNGNGQPLFEVLKSKMPASHQVSKNIEIPGFVPGLEVAIFLKPRREIRDLNICNLCMKNKERYAEILGKISGHFPCFEVAFVMWLFLVVLREICVDGEYCSIVELHPDTKGIKITRKTNKIVARILKK